MEGDLRCDSPWSCPVCAPARSMLAQEKVGAVATAAQAAGAWMVFATYTLRHNRETPLAALLEVLNASYRKSQQGKAFTKLADVYAYVGGTKAIEVRWSARFGWHPHLHAVHFFNSRETDALAGTRALVERYREQVAKLGGYASPAAQDVRSCYDPEGAGKYSTKGACELTNSASKSFDNARNKSLSPFDLLKFSADKQVPKHLRSMYADLFREFAGAMAGKPLCRVSSKLTREYCVSETEVAPQSPPDLADDRLHVSSVLVRDACSKGLWSPFLDTLETLKVWRGDAVKALVVQLSEKLGRKEDPEILGWVSRLDTHAHSGSSATSVAYKSRHFVH